MAMSSPNMERALSIISNGDAESNSSASLGMSTELCTISAQDTSRFQITNQVRPNSGTSNQKNNLNPLFSEFHAPHTRSRDSCGNGRHSALLSALKLRLLASQRQAPGRNSSRRQSPEALNILSSQARPCSNNRTTNITQLSTC
jgi:hypothetical protein